MPLFLLFAAAVTLEPMHGPFASAEEACGAPLQSPSEGSAFCRRQGLWQLAIRDGDGWYVGPLPVQEGVTPIAVEGVPGNYRARFAQHAFRPLGLDVDGEWLWPCVGHACTNDAVPVEIHDHSGGGDIEIAGDVVMSNGKLDVVFWKLRILGDTKRAAEWRSLVEKLRGEHSLTLPP